MKEMKVYVSWFKLIMTSVIILLIYNIMKGLEIYAISCVVMIVVVTLLTYYTFHEAEKDREKMQPKPIHFQHMPRSKRRSVSMKIEQLRKFQSNAFEQYIAHLYRQLGYHAKVTRRSGDGGKDIILKDSLGKTFYVECKCYAKQSVVGRPVIQKLVAAAKGDNVTPLATVTTGRFTKGALEEAKKTDVQCIGPTELLQMIATVDEIEKNGTIRIHRTYSN